MNANIIRRASSLLVLGLGLVSMVACSGGGGGSSFAPPAATVDVNGTWAVTLFVDTQDCGGQVEEQDDQVDMIQDGTNVQIIPQNGDPIDGTIAGNVITLSTERVETDPDTGLSVRVKEQYRLEVNSDSNTFTGTGSQSLEIEGLFDCTAPVNLSGQRL
ncbi:MAG: hypothetical protein RL885_15105 [Planctomycetota bacterium]